MENLTDRDLLSIQEARSLAERAHTAAQILRSFTQEQVDAISRAMCDAGFKESERLARLAVDDTGFGRYEDKILKNRFATRDLGEYIKDMKTVGFLDPPGPVRRVAEPMGVVAAVIPSTNPTSTALYKAIISLKARNSIVMSPHPGARNCIMETGKVMDDAARSAGAPEGSVNCMTIPELAGTNELMRHPKIGVILATGGTGLVKAAYSAGKPAFGVGPGNVPAFIERTADPEKAVKDITASKCFDNGTICASEQSIVVDKPLDSRVRELLKSTGSHFCAPEETAKLERAMITHTGGIDPKIVGQPSTQIASIAGFSIPDDTKMLIVEIDGVGKDFPLSIEKLSPVICYYVVDGWEAGCELSIEILEFGGMGHTMALHTNDRNVVERFALEKPAMRVTVNTPASQGGIGYTTNLAPALTLGCGTWGGSVTGDNIDPSHLLNIKRLAYETKPINPGKTTLDTGSSIRWRYDDQYRYRPETEIQSAQPAESPFKPRSSVIPSPSPQTEKLIEPDKTYGDGISEVEVGRVMREFGGKGNKLRKDEN